MSMGGVYLLIPKSFTLKNYLKIFNSGYMRGFYNSMFIAVVGTAIAMMITVPLGLRVSPEEADGKKDHHETDQYHPGI